MTEGERVYHYATDGSGAGSAGVRAVISLKRWLLLMLVCAAAAAPAAETPGSGGVGINKFDLMLQYLGTASGGDGSPPYVKVTRAMARKALDDARDVGVPYVRVSAAGFAPSAFGAKGDLDRWRSDPEEHWQRVDAMMDDLDERGIRLVPVLMWNVAQFPSMTGETVADLIRSPGSASWQLLERYVTDFVIRYRKRQTVLFYEMSNELNLGADLDNVARCQKERPGPLCAPAGNYSTDEMIAFTERFAALVKRLDPARRLSSGFSVPRGSAAHLRLRPQWSPRGADWTADSRDEFMRYLAEVHGPVDIVSIHLYDNEQNRRFGSGDATDLIAVAKQAADRAGKALFIGEFGDAKPGQAADGSYVDRAMRRIQELGVPYGALWVWQFYQKKTYATQATPHDAFSIEPGYTDWVIARLKRANARAGQSAPAGADAVPPRLVLTWPLDCALVKGPEKLFAVASDDRGKVERVEFWAGGRRLADDRAPPYEAEFDPAALSPGEYDILAKAFDAAGNAATWKIRILVGLPPARIKACAAGLERR